MRKFHLRLFKQDSSKTLLEHLKGDTIRSPKALKSYLGKRGLKLSFETSFRWAITYEKEIVGFMKLEH